MRTTIFLYVTEITKVVNPLSRFIIPKDSWLQIFSWLAIAILLSQLIGKKRNPTLALISPRTCLQLPFIHRFEVMLAEIIFYNRLFCLDRSLITSKIWGCLECPLALQVSQSLIGLEGCSTTWSNLIHRYSTWLSVQFLFQLINFWLSQFKSVSDLTIIIFSFSSFILNASVSRHSYSYKNFIVPLCFVPD